MQLAPGLWQPGTCRSLYPDLTVRDWRDFPRPLGPALSSMVCAGLKLLVPKGMGFLLSQKARPGFLATQWPLSPSRAGGACPHRCRGPVLCVPLKAASSPEVSLILPPLPSSAEASLSLDLGQGFLGRRLLFRPQVIPPGWGPLCSGAPPL